jgi:PilZ domain
MAWGDRKGTRVSFERGVDALMMGIDGTWRRECHLVDVSVSGAKLIVSGSMEGLNLKEFFLLLTPTGTTFRRCELVRANGAEIGVRFLTKSDVRKPARRPASAPVEIA